MSTPLEKYQSDLTRDDFEFDSSQQQAVEAIQKLYDELLRELPQKSGMLHSLRSLIGGESVKIKGLYIWGGVGRGKTYLVDCFYACLPFKEKQRMHFHRFMQSVHNQLRELKHMESPLEQVAENITKSVRVICFDEFHVSDITDAMLLSGLFEGLFQRGVVLVATSNQHPDNLYQGGLQRERFLPAIEMIKSHTRVFNLDSGVDYRLRFFDKAEIYHTPLDSDAMPMLQTSFSHISPDAGEADKQLEIEGREIATVRCGGGVVWFEFTALCDGPRGPADYIELARQFQTVLIANVPVMGDMENDMAKRFMTMIDEFYDRNVKVIITAEANPEVLYRGKQLSAPFQRTLSRLEEMRTCDYLARPHLSD